MSYQIGLQLPITDESEIFWISQSFKSFRAAQLAATRTYDDSLYQVWIGKVRCCKPNRRKAFKTYGQWYRFS